MSEAAHKRRARFHAEEKCREPGRLSCLFLTFCDATVDHHRQYSGFSLLSLVLFASGRRRIGNVGQGSAVENLGGGIANVQKNFIKGAMLGVTINQRA